MYKIEFWGGFKDGWVEYCDVIPTTPIYYAHAMDTPLSEEDFNEIINFEGRSVEYFKYTPRKKNKKIQMVFEGIV